MKLCSLYVYFLAAHGALALTQVLIKKEKRVRSLGLFGAIVFVLIFFVQGFKVLIFSMKAKVADFESADVCSKRPPTNSPKAGNRRLDYRRLKALSRKDDSKKFVDYILFLLLLSCKCIFCMLFHLQYILAFLSSVKLS